MKIIDPTEYGDAFTRLLAEERLPALGPGTPNTGVRNELDALTIETAFAGCEVADESMARACISAMWLYHDFLDESHRLSQRIKTPTGSYWHGIIHRREPDASNSRYWLRRVGEHPVFERLRDAASKALDGQSGDLADLVAAPAWDPFGFTDLCERARLGESDLADGCRLIQQIEFELLFDFSYRAAIGG